MKEIDTLLEDFASLALGINGEGTVVGASLSASFSPRAFLWKKGVTTDLNNLVPSNSPLYLLFASLSTSSGES